LRGILTNKDVISSEDKSIISKKDRTVNGYSLFIEFSFWYDLGKFVHDNTPGYGFLKLDHSLPKEVKSG